MVMVGGQHEDMVLTDDPWISLWPEDNGLGTPAIVASKTGHRAVGCEYFEPDTPITIKIRAVNPPDNEEYVYQDPGDGFDTMQENCSHRHSPLYKNLTLSIQSLPVTPAS